MEGLILVAHGSKKDLSNKEFVNLVNLIKQKDKNFSQIEAAFLEFASPNIFDVVDDFVKKGISTIYIYPYFLNSGKHVSIDLPNIIQMLDSSNSLVKFILLRHFGKSEMISDIILEDILLLK